MATPEKQPHYNNEVASQMIWEFLSIIFTVSWSKNQEKVELRRFGTPAEECLQKTQKYQKKIRGILWNFLIYCGMMYLTYIFWGTRTPWIAGAALIGAIFFIVRIVVGFREAQRIRPGKTIMEVAEQWSKTKKLIIASDFLHSLETTLKYGDHKFLNLVPANGGWVQCFKDTIQNTLRVAGTDLGTAETEQDEPARRRLRARYEALFSLAKTFEVIGINASFGSFLPTRTPVEKKK